LLNLRPTEHARHHSTTRRERIAIGVRQRCPGRPNFRDFGMTVDSAYLRLIENLQRRHGHAWGSDDMHRSLIEQSTGHCPGVGTLYAARVRLEAAGLLESRWIRRGALRPDGSVATVGCLQLRVPRSSAERRAVAERAVTLNRKRDVIEKLSPMPRKLAGFVAAMTSTPLPPTPRPRVDDGALERLEAWASAEGLTERERYGDRQRAPGLPGNDSQR
jgi:hypothetical protein